MKVILLEDVKSLGKKGETEKTKPFQSGGPAEQCSHSFHLSSRSGKFLSIFFSERKPFSGPTIAKFLLWHKRFPPVSVIFFSGLIS